MATLATRLSDLATRIASECKSIRTLVNGNASSNVTLITTAKSNLVAAINEVKAQINNSDAAGYAKINDTATSGATITYSVDKIKSEIASTAAATKDAILGGAGAAYDTLSELQALIQGEAADITNIMTALGNRLRVDINNQGLTATQKANGRANLDAYGSVELGNPDTDFTVVFANGLV